MKMVGILSAANRNNKYVAAFFDRMEDLGWNEGINITYDRQFANGEFGKLRNMARDLVELGVDVILAGSSPAIRAARQATKTIPIVMGVTGDPFVSGGIASLSVPGGNVTGMSDFNENQHGEQVECLVQAIGGNLMSNDKIGIVYNPDNPGKNKDLRATRKAIRSKSLIPVDIEVTSEATAAGAFAAATGTTPEGPARSCKGLVILGDPVLGLPKISTVIRKESASLAIEVIYGALEVVNEGALDGGLMAYGPSHRQVFRRAAEYVDWILKGAAPSNLPVGIESVMQFHVNKTVFTSATTTSPPGYGMTDANFNTLMATMKPDRIWP